MRFTMIATYFAVILITLVLMSIYIIGLLNENLYSAERIDMFAKANIIAQNVSDLREVAHRSVFLPAVVFKIAEHRYAYRMPAALKFVVQKRVGNVKRQSASGCHCAEAQNVCVVVHSCVARGVGVRTERRTDSAVFVRRHGHSDAGPAKQYADVAGSALHLAADLVRVNRVVYRVRAVCSAVLAFVAV